MNENLVLGLQMMGIGMGFVLCFLCLLIFSMMVMSKVVGYLNKIFPEAVEEVKKVAKKVAGDEDSVIAAVIAAVVAKKA
ncbi:MAG: OadG family protein [Fusobacterium sp.]|nr:OadG family protein [Fusobacterium sp.]